MKIVDFDAITNITTERQMTKAEQDQYKILADIAQQEAEAQAAAQAERAAARQAVLDKLGLTQDEAQALLG